MKKKQRKWVRGVLRFKKCLYCGSKENLTIDHRVPIILGGTYNLENLQCLCGSCNRAKSAMLHEDFLRVSRYWESVIMRKLGVSDKKQWSKLKKKGL